MRPATAGSGSRSRKPCAFSLAPEKPFLEAAKEAEQEPESPVGSPTCVSEQWLLVDEFKARYSPQTQAFVKNSSLLSVIPAGPASPGSHSAAQSPAAARQPAPRSPGGSGQSGLQSGGTRQSQRREVNTSTPSILPIL
uniref:Uncharacterized protein n=1 Tax=Pipistrellus kuhlii TaxID=59472 RepID=A0A7J7TNM6_PIPKU|nr:hypothetical protein mPipKuh1_009317 [Pipistrellus kuhlii]